jgi:hypothetical protein
MFWDIGLDILGRTHIILGRTHIILGRTHITALSRQHHSGPTYKPTMPFSSRRFVQVSFVI